MAGKRYSAGAIFLQVVPVFANVQKAIESEADGWNRTIGDQMEKAGEKGGERAGKAASKKMNEELAKGSGQFERDFHKSVDGINSALAGIDANKLGNNLRRELASIKRELAGLKDVDLTIDLDRRKVDQAIAELEGRLRAMRDDTKVVFRADIDNALKGFAKIEAAKAAISDPVEIEVSADFKSAERQMTVFEKQFKRTAERASKHLSGSMHKEVQRIRDELKYLENLRIGVDISSGRARTELNELMRELEQISADEVDIDVKVEAIGAFGEIEALEKQLRKLDNDDINIDVDVDTGRARASLFGLKRSGDDAANSFRSFNAILLAAAGAGPAIVPVLAAIAGGLFAIGPAAAVAGAGLGSVLIGFSGIGDAVTALQARDDQAAVASNKAAKSQIDNSQAIADARRSAARQIESALDAQVDAQKRYADSLDEVRDAEQALAEARREARGTGADINESIRDNQLAQDQGLLDVFNATVAFDAISADGSATNAEQEQARIALEEARDRLSDLRKEAKELAKEKKKWDQEGVNGTEEVQSAQEHLNDAIDAQREAYEDLRDAAEAVDEARADGARQVADAMRNQAQAMEQVTAQQNNVDNAMDKLGPAGRKFALFIFGLRDEFYAFRDDIQQVLLPSVQKAIEGFFGSRSGETLRKLMINLARGFGDFVEALSRSFQGPVWLEFFRTLNRLGPGIQKAYGQAFIAFLEGMASILTILAPFALQFAEAFRDVMRAFAEWADSQAARDLFSQFLDYVREVAPHVVDFLMALAHFALVFAEGLAQWGETVLDGLTRMLNAMSSLDPKVLAVVVTTLLILITASQTAYAIMNLLMAGAALFTSTVGIIVFAIVGAGLALVYLYKTNEEFRDFVQDAWPKIRDAFLDAWDKIKPALSELWTALQDLWKEVLEPLMEWLGPVLVWIATILIKVWAFAFTRLVHTITFGAKVIVGTYKFIAQWVRWLWNSVLKPVWGFMKAAWGFLVDAMVWVWKHILKATWNDIATTIKWLWENVLRPKYELMKKGWSLMVDGMKWVWQHVLKPVWDFITDKALPKLKNAFDKTVDAIKKIWDGLKKVVAMPVKFVIDTIINNGLIDGFNKIAGWVHLPKLDHVPMPSALQSYATGGVMPGYTPGRDVHKFVSPTGGRLELSGGEAIMRPEFTAAVGPDWVNAMNAVARTGGTDALRKYLGGQAFAKGGIFFPLPGAHMGTYAGHDGVDLNVGSGSDDLGMPFYSATSGRVTTTGYSRGYGNAVFIASPYGELVYGHSLDGSIGVHPGQSVNPGSYLARVGSTGNSSGPHLHFGFPGGSYEAALALLSGATSGAHGPVTEGAQEPHHPSIPDYMKSFIRDPLSVVRHWVTDQWGKASDFVNSSPIFDAVKQVPLLAAKGITDKLWGGVPGWAKTAIGYAGKGAHWVVGGIKEIGDTAGHVGHAVSDGAGAVADFLFKDGGIMPYNGTMKYDSGGYLPPGLTSVLNLTGQPEPVFTNDQWKGMEDGEAGGNIYYEPHFEGSDLTSEDVADDFNFTVRRLRRSGKYGKVGSS